MKAIRFVIRLVATKRNDFISFCAFVLSAQNEISTPGLDSFCAPPIGAHTKRIQPNTACAARQTNHQTSWRQTKTSGPRGVTKRVVAREANPAALSRHVATVREPGRGRRDIRE